MIGILGGMGPLATVGFYKIFIDVVACDYNIEDNHEFPEMMIHNIPVHFPSFDPRSGTCPGIHESIHSIKESIEMLSKNGVKIYGMPCNTFHLYDEELKNKVGNRGQFISMVEETIEIVKLEGHTHIGILGTETTINLGLYEDRFDDNYSIYKLSDEGRKKTVNVIENVVAGKILKADADIMEGLIDELQDQGAQCIILGCTELPLIVDTLVIKDTIIYNPVRILVKSLLRQYYLHSLE